MIKQFSFARILHRFQSVMQLQFIEDIMNVILYRLFFNV